MLSGRSVMRFRCMPARGRRSRARNGFLTVSASICHQGVPVVFLGDTKKITRGVQRLPGEPNALNPCDSAMPQSLGRERSVARIPSALAFGSERATGQYGPACRRLTDSIFSRLPVIPVAKVVLADSASLEDASVTGREEEAVRTANARGLPEHASALARAYATLRKLRSGEQGAQALALGAPTHQSSGGKADAPAPDSTIAAAASVSNPRHGALMWATYGLLSWPVKARYRTLYPRLIPPPISLLPGATVSPPPETFAWLRALGLCLSRHLRLRT